MDDDLISQFSTITNAPPHQARQYLQISEGHLEQAIELFFANGGADLGPPSPVATSSHPPPVPHATRPRPPADSPIDLDNSDHDDIMDLDDDDEEPPTAATRSLRGARPASPPAPQPSAEVDADEAMARRLQEELYAGGDMRGAAAPVDADGYRAPIARTQETLVGPGDDFDASDPDDMRAMVLEQMRQRDMHRRRGELHVFTRRVKHVG